MSFRTTALGIMAVIVSAGTPLHAQVAKPAPFPVNSMAGPMANLAAPISGVPKHEGSWDRGGGNADMRGVEPGQTLTLFDYKGAGIVRRLWVTIAPRAHEDIHRKAILRMYWDGESTPSVEAPIGDFFGVGFGKQVDFESLPLNQLSGGYNCYWPMPFHKSARWTLTNLSNRRIDAFYYNIDFTAYDKLDPSLRHFHAQWRRENPTTPNKNYTILDATGAGHFVGTALYMQNRRGRSLGFLEGDEMIWVDGEKDPSIIGTGAEDYFSSGWYYDRGPYSGLQHGVPIKDTKLGRISTYRWHIDDAMPFQKSILVTIEHGTNNDHEGDYSSVAYWYQTEPHKPFPALSTDPETYEPFLPPPPMKINNALEGEGLLGSAKATSGSVSEQEMTVFGNRWSEDAHLWWQPARTGETLTVQLPAPSDGQYNVTGYFTKGPDYGTVEIRLGDQVLVPSLSFYDASVVPSGPVSLGTVALKAGDNALTVRVTGRDASSSGYLVGIDAFVLRPAGGAAMSMNSTPARPARTLICAHRGASAAAPENTLAAFRLARQLGADQFELDTTITAEGVPVVIHDGAVDRTTDGSGDITKMTLAEVQKLDAGSWKDAKYKGEPIPTLEAVFKEFKDYSINVEIKGGASTIVKTAERVVDLINKYNMADKVIISSFSTQALQRVLQLNPTLKTGFLYSGETPKDLIPGLAALHPYTATVTPEFAAWAKSQGYALNVWTVNDPKEMERLIALGVDSIITDVPDRMKALQEKS